jgi:glycosyltransferase involved in cell wall biosynthesis
MPPLVSIIIPCYNAGPWLAPTIESALAQTWPQKELIVVDDGSTDESLAIARSFASLGVIVVAQANRGQGAACNHGLRVARGEFIKFLDADDLLSPGMIERQVGALADRPGCVAYGEWARFHDDPAEARFIAHPGGHDGLPVDWLVEIWRDAQPMMQCALFLLPRALLDRTGGWDERLSLINDFEFFARIVTASAGVVFTPGALLYYRSGLSRSLSGRKTTDAWRSAFVSITTGTQHLLAVENSSRTRRVAATILRGLAFDMYPSMPNLVEQLEARSAALGGADNPPLGGKGFQVVRRILGWKTARWLQVWAGKFPPPARP